MPPVAGRARLNELIVATRAGRVPILRRAAAANMDGQHNEVLGDAISKTTALKLPSAAFAINRALVG
jgi:hypothetical protein